MSGSRSHERPGVGPSMLWAQATDHGHSEDRLIDPAPLARLIEAWSRSDGEPLEVIAREMVQDANDGPVHLVRLVAAMEASARATGGTLSRVTDTPAVTDVCGGVLHHLIEVLRASGLRAATTAAGQVDIESRLLAVKALQTFWQAPHRALCEPLHDVQVLQPSRTLWRS